MISSIQRRDGEGSHVRSVPRSHLYVPADQPRFLRSAASVPADAVIYDLEDGVAPGRKDHAREAAVEALAERGDDGRERWVRINTGERGRADARAIVAAARPDGIWLPKASPEEARDIGALLDEADSAAALGLMIETAAAVLRLAQPLPFDARRVIRLQLGEMDLRADLGMPDLGRAGAAAPGRAGALDAGVESDLDWVRGMTVAFCVATGLEPPVGPVYADISDSEGFRASCQRLRRFGYHGRACVHPRQVEIANEVFAVTEAEMEAARALLDRFDDAVADGRGAFRDVTGAMVDAASVRTARRLAGRDRAAPARTDRGNGEDDRRAADASRPDAPDSDSA